MGESLVIVALLLACLIALLLIWVARRDANEVRRRAAEEASEARKELQRQSADVEQRLERIAEREERLRRTGNACGRGKKTAKNSWRRESKNSTPCSKNLKTACGANWRASHSYPSKRRAKRLPNGSAAKLSARTAPSFDSPSAQQKPKRNIALPRF